MPTATGALWKQMALLGKHTLCNFLFCAQLHGLEVMGACKCIFGRNAVQGPFVKK